MSWETQANKLSALIQRIFNDNLPAIKDNARTSPQSVYVLSDDDLKTISDQVEESTQEIRKLAASDVEGAAIDAGSSLDSTFVSTASFYAVKSITDAINRVHSTSIARQILKDDEREEAIERSISAALTEITSNAESESAASYTLYHREIAIETGFEYYVYLTSGDDVVRPTHNRRNGKAFKYGAERVSADVPGLERNCRCTASPITAEEALDYTFYYADDAPIQAKKTMVEIFAKLQPESKNVVIDIEGNIEKASGNDAETLIRKVNDNLSTEDQELIINLTSKGGMADEAFNAYDFLESLPNKITTNIYGYAGSAATQFSNVADLSTIGKNDKFFIHKSWACPCGNADTLTDAVDSFIEALDEVDRQQIKRYQSKIQRSGKQKTPQQILDLMKQEREISAQEALDFGLVDEIREDSKRSQAARGEPIARANFQALSQVQTKRGEPMPTVEELEAKLSAKDDKIAALKTQLQTEQGKVEVLAAKKDDIPDEKRKEIYASARAEILAEQESLSTAKSDVESAGIKPEGDDAKAIYANALKEKGFGGFSEGYEEIQLKEIFAAMAKTSAQGTEEFEAYAKADKKEEVLSPSAAVEAEREND